MEGFKQNQKMKCDLPCYKEGGFVKRDKAKHSESTEMKKDVAKDKKIVKKAFKIHDEQSHDEKTDLSKLKKGGRAKKEVGTVKKYKKGGSVKKMAGGGMGAQTDAELAMAKQEGKEQAMAQRNRRKYAYGEINGMPATESQMQEYEASEAARPRSQSEMELDDFATKAKAKSNLMRGLQAVGEYAYGGKVC
jgi:hypothetical protein